MKFFFTLLYVLTIQVAAFSQYETNNWYFGNQAGLDFISSPPSIRTNGVLNTWEGCSSISDGSSGNLLFYTDGVTIYNKNHAVMSNGTGLSGNSTTTQSGLIIKQPGKADIYFVFTLGAAGTGSLCVSTVDMNLAGGLGAVTVKNTLLNTNMTEKLTACLHCNGNDVWVLAHKNKSSNFTSYLVNAAGVNTTPVVTSIGTIHGVMQPGDQGWGGPMKFSPNGRKLGLGIHGRSGGYEMYDFDNATGVLSNSLTLASFFMATGCEFSPDGSKFYGTDYDGSLTNCVLHQWDLCAGSSTAIVASQYTMSTYVSPGSTVTPSPASSFILGMQMASNGKVYVSKLGDNQLGVIDNPNAPGASCNYIHTGQALGWATCRICLPNFMTGYFKPAVSVPPVLPFTYTVDCGTVSFNSSSAIAYTLDAGCGAVASVPFSTLWSFGDPAAGSANSSTLTNPSYIYSTPGTYNVQLIRYNACSSDTIRSTVTTSSITPSIRVAGNFTICSGEKNIYTVSGAGSYTWNTGSHTNSISLTPTTTTVLSVAGTGANSCVGSKQLTITVSKCTGIELIGGQDKSFSIYPNPSNGNLFIEASTAIKIRVMDKSGRLLLETSFENGKHNLDISSLSNGIYMVQAITGKSVTTTRLVKIE